MNFKIEKLDAKSWAVLSENAHLSVFKEIKPQEWDRIDYALLATNEQGDPIGYMTCREFDSKSVYWQYGGSFPPIVKTIYTMKVYEAFKNWHKDRYERIATYIENTNSTMLKMAAKIGFLITGIRNFKGQVLLEHLLEFKNAK